ncbi:MAG TPA: SRPBCC family protein [Candidatus Limnocylindrales bacterium]|nr:SRPBCC family protein [Candidatus Limnocylindrales bacterium]
MAAIDVTTEIVIDRSLEQVSTYAADPTNAPEWYENIESVHWKTAPPVSVGSKMDFVAHMMGRRLAYTYEVAELVPGQRLVMRTAEGPFPMETTYTWETTPEGGTRMRLRNRGMPSGFARVGARLMAAVVRRETSKNLKALKLLLEKGTAG